MTEHTYYSAKPGVMDCDIGGERALLHLETNEYFTLNQAASKIWLTLTEPKSLEDLVEVITNSFEVTAAQCRPDIEELLEQMKSANVVEKIEGSV